MTGLRSLQRVGARPRAIPSSRGGARRRDGRVAGGASCRSLCSAPWPAPRSGSGLCHPSPATRDAQACVGWACVFYDVQARHFGVLSGSVPSWAPENLNAYLAECLGLLYGGLVATNLFRDRQVVFLSDCIPALGAAAGTSQFAPDGLPQATRHVHDLALAWLERRPHYQHVPGHAGVMPNELADVVAKAAGRGVSVGGFDGPVASLHHRWLANGAPDVAWLAVAIRGLRGESGLPPPCGGGLGDDTYHGGLSNSDLLAPFMSGPAATDEGLREDCQLALRVVTYNVLTLSGAAEASQGVAPDTGVGLAFKPARPALLARQLSQLRVDIAALQETRCEKGSLRCGDFLRYCSGAERGQLGVELWFRTRNDFAVGAGDGKSSLRFTPQAFVMLRADARRLIMRYSDGGLTIVFASLHAPHRGSEDTVLLRWWHDTLLLMRRYASDALVVAGGDFNASVGNVVSDFVSDWAGKEQDLAGEQLHALLQACAAWLPSSFEGVHNGPSATFVQKRNGRPTRPDFVLLPLAWRWGQLASWLDPGLHSGHDVQDHTAAFVDVQVCVRAAGKKRPQRRRRIDSRVLSDPRRALEARQALLTAPVVPWGVSAHAHAALVVHHLQVALAPNFSTAPSAPKHAYITAETWALQREVSNLRRALRRLAEQISTQLLLVCFNLWRTGETSGLLCFLNSPWRRETRHAAAMQTHALSRRIRR